LNEEKNVHASEFLSISTWQTVFDFWILEQTDGLRQTIFIIPKTHPLNKTGWHLDWFWLRRRPTQNGGESAWEIFITQCED